MIPVAVFAYNFPHWKTQQGLLNLAMQGIYPEIVYLQDRKELNIEPSSVRITFEDEFLHDPKDICRRLKLQFEVVDHDMITGVHYLGIILGARILPQRVIDRCRLGILNIHPGILPGNRGLDNIKHSIRRGLPIGATAHLIDNRIDMGMIIRSEEIRLSEDDHIRDLFNKVRNLEQKLLSEVAYDLVRYGVHHHRYTPCEWSEKFSVLKDDKHIILEAARYIFERTCLP